MTDLFRLVHSVLGGKVVYLPLVGFGFAALAGIGLGLMLNYLNPYRIVLGRRSGLLGALFLGGGLPLGLLCLLLGLP